MGLKLKRRHKKKECEDSVLEGKMDFLLDGMRYTSLWKFLNFSRSEDLDEPSRMLGINKKLMKIVLKKNKKIVLQNCNFKCYLFVYQS